MLNPFIPMRQTLGSKKRFTTDTMPTFENPGIRRDPMDEIPHPEQDEGSKYFDELEKIRQGSRGPALSAYQQALKEQPTYDKYKPSGTRKLGSALAAAAASLKSGPEQGLNLGLSIRDAPYTRAKAEYGERMKGLGASAKLEQDETEAQLSAYKAARLYGQKQLEDAQKWKHDAGMLGVAERGADTSDFVANTGRINSGINARNAGTNEYVARTGRINSDINAYGATTGRMNANSTAANVGSEITDRVERQKIARDAITASIQRAQIAAGKTTLANPRAQQDAIDGSLRELITDPRYKDFITQPDPAHPDILDLGPDDGTEGYQAFKNALIEATNRRLQTGLPLGKPGASGVAPDVDIFTDDNKEPSWW